MYFTVIATAKVVGLIIIIAFLTTTVIIIAISFRL